MDEVKKPLGEAPSVLAKRIVKSKTWCSKPDIEFDHWCDAYNPKTVSYKEIAKAASYIKEVIPMTPLVKSNNAKDFGMDLHYKYEIFHRTGSFNERGALYSLMMLNPDEKSAGVITASLGNWAMSLAYHGHKLSIPVMVVLPVFTTAGTVEKCQDYGATVILYGKDLSESKRHAFVLLAENGRTYINGYDHPHCIAGSGTIGLEIMEQLPLTDAVLIPVGGGGLLAGIAVAVKHINPEVLIYGIEPDKCCSFFKAMDNEEPYRTIPGRSLAESLAVPSAGYNAYYTAKSLIDKMVLVDDDLITRAILHMVENERLVVEGAGAVSLSALLAVPDILPELRDKNVVCVITGGNIDTYTLSSAMQRGKAVEGRIIQLTVTLPVDKTSLEQKILRIVGNVGGNVLESHVEPGWVTDGDIFTIDLVLKIETTSLAHACTLKRVMERLFPNMCDFLEEPFSPIPMCACFPKRFA